MKPNLYYIRESYFHANSTFIKMLDTGNINKQSKRTHLCIMIENNGNTFYIPLRNNLGAELRKFGRIGHSVPSVKRPNAGLDYRYALLINNISYLEIQTDIKIPHAQYNKILQDYDIIKKEFYTYLNGFIKAYRKNRIEKEPLYRESCLVNFIHELTTDNN